MDRTVNGFLKTVLRSGLLTHEQLRAVLRGQSRQVRNDPSALAEHLVKEGQLSRFQADKLLQGTALGLLLGPYQVLSPIGKGGMGTVYLARDSRNGELLALKILPPKRARAEERLLARFLREMELNRRVAHPHLARTFEAGEHRGVYFIAMEFIPGKSLSRVIGDDGPLPVRRAAALFAEICSALEHAHGQKLIHRDLKPSNIMVTPNDHAKLLDLGLALVQGEVGEDREVIGGAGYVVGSMDWIAPEQTEDATGVDERSDLYGLGCTFYHALSGRPPFPGGTNRDKMRRHRSEDPPRLEVLNPQVPPTFADLVHKLMAKSPSQRFQTAAAVRQQLLPWVSDARVLPLDRPGDTNFQRAVTRLQLAEVPQELIEVVLVNSEEPAAQHGRGPSAVPGGGTPAGVWGRDLVWLSAGLLGFWVVLFAVLGLVLLLR